MAGRTFSPTGSLRGVHAHTSSPVSALRVLPCGPFPPAPTRKSVAQSDQQSAGLFPSASSASVGLPAVWSRTSCGEAARLPKSLLTLPVGACCSGLPASFGFPAFMSGAVGARAFAPGVGPEPAQPSYCEADLELRPSRQLPIPRLAAWPSSAAPRNQSSFPALQRAAIGLP
jgi:hypothetical protein